MVKIGINGFNEIGRCLVRMAAQSNGEVGVVHINCPLAETGYMAYQLRYSSSYGRFPGRISEETEALIVGNNRVAITSSEKMADADWSDCDVVIDCEKCRDEKDFGNAKKVIISGACAEKPLVDYGLNHKAAGGKAVSQACAATSAIAVLGGIINRAFGIENAICVNLTAFDGESRDTDGCNPKKWRNGRASDSVIPEVCGGAQGAGVILPELNGLISGIALRVPVKSVSMLNFVCKLKSKTEYSNVVDIMKQASENEFRGLFGVTDESVVSCDFVGCPLPAVADIRAGILQGGNLLKITAWYDGMWSHCSKLIKLAIYMGSL